jgi:hypothetical protein
MDRLRNLEGRSEGDPRKIAEVIVQLANSDEVPLRVTLGVDRSNLLKANHFREFRAALGGPGSVARG